MQFYVWELKLFLIFSLNLILKGVGEVLCGFVCPYQNRMYRAKLGRAGQQPRLLLIFDVSDYFTGDASEKYAVVFLI